MHGPKISIWIVYGLKQLLLKGKGTLLVINAIHIGGVLILMFSIFFKQYPIGLSH